MPRTARKKSEETVWGLQTIPDYVIMDIAGWGTTPRPNQERM